MGDGGGLLGGDGGLRRLSDLEFFGGGEAGGVLSGEEGGEGEQGELE